MAKKKRINSQPSSCKIYVEGMHCASCEILIEKKLLKQEGVEFVDASQSTGQVVVKYSKDKPDIEELNLEFRKLGYSFSTNQPKTKTPALFSFTSGGQLKINAKKLKQLMINTVVIVSLIVLFLWVGESGIAPDYLTELSPSSSPTLFAGMGLIAGISSCAALVGGLLLSMSKQWNEAYIAEDNLIDRSQPHIMFHLGRLFSFFILGGLLGAVFPSLAGLIGVQPNQVFESELFTTGAQLLVSMIMLILALQMLEVGWATKIRIGLPKFISRFASRDNVQGRYAPLLTGALTFFLPCGFTLLAQGIALASGDFITGATIMSAFALGTMPVLLGISISSIGFNAKPHFTARFNQIVGVFILFIALFNIFNFASGYLTTLAPAESSSQLVAVDQDGFQVIELTAAGSTYTAIGSTKIEVGVPTKLKVNNLGAVGCYAFVTGKGLFDGFVPLDPGVNLIEFTPESKGKFWIDCAMYMVRQPVLVEVV